METKGGPGMQRATQAPQPASFPQNMLLGLGIWEHLALTLVLGFCLRFSNCWNPKIFLLLLIFPPLSPTCSHSTQLSGGCRDVTSLGITLCFLQKEPWIMYPSIFPNPVSRSKFYIQHHQIIHSALKYNVAPALTTHPSPPHPTKQNPKTKLSRYFGSKLFIRKNKLHT